ncbi:MAG TPA: acetyl-CoA acetyltransferase [Steroidobacteraceae bacterium]|nr:acetyl-CoA acetyltransferase [Steroidobacteraceae bacterium]
MPDTLRGKAAIVGAADTEVGVIAGMGATELCIDAILRALRDAGIGKDAVDGLVTCNSMAEPLLYHAEAMAEYLQIFPRYCVSVGAGGGTTFTALHQAASAIASGICSTVVVAMADSLRSGMSRERALAMQSSSGHPEFERPYGAPVPGYYALIARAHMHEYGTTPAQLAAVAVSARKHAARNPAAEKRAPISIADVLESRLIADPLHLLDCSLVSDGGAAIVMTSAERARDFRHPPVYLLGAGEGHSHEHISQARSLTTSAAADAGRRAFAMAGLGPADVDLAQLYDCFTPVVIIELEDLGFCAKGEGGAFVAAGNIAPGGALPVNTHGGLLSHCHPGNPGSMFALTEAVLQLRGQAGGRQLAKADIALVHGQGGIMSSHCTIVLGREAG